MYSKHYIYMHGNKTFKQNQGYYRCSKPIRFIFYNYMKCRREKGKSVHSEKKTQAQTVSENVKLNMVSSCSSSGHMTPTARNGHCTAFIFLLFFSTSTSAPEKTPIKTNCV